MTLAASSTESLGLIDTTSVIIASCTQRGSKRHHKIMDTKYFKILWRGNNGISIFNLIPLFAHVIFKCAQFDRSLTRGILDVVFGSMVTQVPELIVTNIKRSGNEGDIRTE